MSLESRIEGSVAIIKWTGQLGVDNFPEFKEGIESLMSQGYSNLVLDMSAIPFIDSRGLGVISGFLRKAKTAQGEFVLAAPQEDVKPIFEITGLKKYATITRTLREALHVFNA